MKSLLSTIFTCFFALATLAQPSLTSDKMLPFGSVMTLKPISDFSIIDTTIKGADVTWDFSSLSATSDPNLVVTIVDPSTTPYSSDFTNSNYAYKESPTTAYRYFNLTSSKMERVGSWSGGVLKTYSDPQVEYVFPLNLGVSNLDTWANSSSSFGGDYNIYCIGYGTLKLPNATYSNALMVRADVDEVIYAFPTYFWYSSDNGAVLLEYIAGDGFFIGESGYYLGSLSSVTTATTKSEITYNLQYNNPADNTLHLSFTSKEAGPLKYSIANTTGDILITADFPYNSSSQYETDIELTALTQGMYVLMIQSNQYSEVIKFIKK